MAGIGRFFSGVFSFFSSKSSQEERVAAYLIREHDRGRSVQDILDDPYVKNRATEAEIARVLERPDVIRAIGGDVAEAAQSASDS